MSKRNSEETPTIPGLPNNTEEALATQQELMEVANEALKLKVQWIQEWTQRTAREGLMSRWELGTQLVEVIEDRERHGCRTYGEGSLITLAVFAGEPEWSLRTCARLAQLFTRGQMEDMAEQTLANGQPLSFSHIRVALAIDDPGERQLAINLAIQNSWTSDQLGKYVVMQNGGSKSNNPVGRPVGKPKNASAAIRQQLQYADDFEKRNATVWKNPKFSLTAYLAKETEETYTEDLADKLGQLAHRMRQLSVEANERAREAENRFNDVRSALDRKKGLGPKKASTIDAFVEAKDQAPKTRRPPSPSRDHVAA